MFHRTWVLCEAACLRTLALLPLFLRNAYATTEQAKLVDTMTAQLVLLPSLRVVVSSIIPPSLARRSRGGFVRQLSQASAYLRT